MKELEIEIEALKLENERLRFELEQYKQAGKVVEQPKDSLKSNLDNIIFGWEENTRDCFCLKDIFDPTDKTEQPCYKECLIDKKLYKNIFVDNTSVMLLLDPYTGKIIDANYAAEKFYGYDISKLTQMNIGDINNLSPQNISNNMYNALHQLENKFYFKHQLANGEIRDVEVNSSPIEINNIRFLHTIIHDITENTKKEELLRKSEKKYQQLFNNVNDILLLFSLEDSKPSCFLEVNSVACNRLGYTYEELLRKTPFDLDNHDSTELSKIFHKLSTTNKKSIGAFESGIITKNNKVIPVEINTHVFQLDGEKLVLAVARDIGRRKLIEKELRLNVEKHKIIMSFLPDAVTIIKGGKIIYINEAGSNMLGYPLTRKLIGAKFINIIHPDYHKSVKQRLKKMNKENCIAPLVEESYIKRNGEAVDVEVTGVKIPYDNSHAFLMVARDITKRKKAIIELDEKIEFEKLRTEFFANISHELRTPLNVILGSLQLLELYDQDDVALNKTEKYIKMHKKMKQNCHRLLRLVNNIIDMTKIDAGFYSINLENCNIISLMKNIVFSVEDYVKNKGITIHLETDLDDVIIACDPEKIERIMLNLLSNAIKFTPKNGQIKVGVKKVIDRLIITVKDTGIGIPKESLGELFNRFTQVDKSLTRNHEGSGIGLSLVESLVQMHQGEIVVESQLNEGSIFIITLPIKKIVGTSRNEDHTYDKELNIERMHIEFSDIYLNTDVIK
ncbi:PAS domain S-box protein [Alkaliphilus transvaalensis]|uniref:PAS domain S-box protein n=1 Tax=Alkaliphilus transvaalensis TaxID=114628 RepID=UPI000687801A|nr:PAS domain S-box protein [Alkaliphilus transvaalensis]